MIKNLIINFTISKHYSRIQFVKEFVSSLDTVVFGGTIVLISDNLDVALSCNIVKIA